MDALELNDNYEVRLRQPQNKYPYYEGKTIYFAVKVGWDDR